MFRPGKEGDPPGTKRLLTRTGPMSRSTSAWPVSPDSPATAPSTGLHSDPARAFVIAWSRIWNATGALAWPDDPEG